MLCQHAPLTTSHSTSLPRTWVTRNSISPSESRMREPGRTSCASPVKCGRDQGRGAGNIARRNRDQRTSLDNTGSCPLSRPVRILGPCKSCRIQIVRFSCFAARRRRAILRACSGCVPWEKFSRATSIPSRIISRSIGSVLHDGPMVQIILARRVAARASSADKSPETRSGFAWFQLI